MRRGSFTCAAKSDSFVITWKGTKKSHKHYLLVSLWRFSVLSNKRKPITLQCTKHLSTWYLCPKLRSFPPDKLVKKSFPRSEQRHGQKIWKITVTIQLYQYVLKPTLSSESQKLRNTSETTSKLSRIIRRRQRHWRAPEKPEEIPRQERHGHVVIVKRIISNTLVEGPLEEAQLRQESSFSSPSKDSSSEQ